MRTTPFYSFNARHDIAIMRMELNEAVALFVDYLRSEASGHRNQESFDAVTARFKRLGLLIDAYLHHPPAVAALVDAGVSPQWVSEERQKHRNELAESDLTLRSMSWRTTHEAAAEAGVSESYMRRLCRKGKVIAHQHPTGTWRVWSPSLRGCRN